MVFVLISWEFIFSCIRLTSANLLGIEWASTNFTRHPFLSYLNEARGSLLELKFQNLIINNHKVSLSKTSLAGWLPHDFAEKTKRQHRMCSDDTIRSDCFSLSLRSILSELENVNPNSYPELLPTMSLVWFFTLGNKTLERWATRLNSKENRWDGGVGNESMIFLGYSVSKRRGWCCVPGGRQKYIISLCMVFCFCFCIFPWDFGKNGFDCEQLGKASEWVGIQGG